MKKLAKPVVFLTLFVLAFGSVSEARIRRVPKRYHVLEGYGGYSNPIGSYEMIGSQVFHIGNQYYSITAGDLYEPTYHLGASYGVLRRNRVYVSLGFTYTKIATLDTFYAAPNVKFYFIDASPSFNQYDFDFNLNVFGANLARRPLAPYLGIGFHGGITTQSARGYASENWVTLAGSINFGIDFVLWRAPQKRSFVTLSSVNSVDLFASDRRPKYLNFGLGLRYFYRP